MDRSAEFPARLEGRLGAWLAVLPGRVALGAVVGPPEACIEGPRQAGRYQVQAVNLDAMGGRGRATAKALSWALTRFSPAAPGRLPYSRARPGRAVSGRGSRPKAQPRVMLSNLGRSRKRRMCCRGAARYSTGQP